MGKKTILSAVEFSTKKALNDAKNVRCAHFLKVEENQFKVTYTG